MLPSGYLIRPCEGGGSIIHIVDHVDLDVRTHDGLASCTVTTRNSCSFSFFSGDGDLGLECA